MNIFIFACAYTAQTLLYNLEYMIAEQIDTVFVLAENHADYDFEKSFSFTIKRLHNVSDCVKNCDLSLIFKHDNIPQQSIITIESLCEKYSKKHITFNDPWMCSRSHIEKNDIINRTSSIPTIDIVYSGLYSQPFIVELLLNKIFSLECIAFEQVFDKSTYDLLLQFKASHILNKKVNLLYGKDYINSPSIGIYSFDIGDKMERLNEYIDYRKDEKPDFIIFQTTLDYIEYVNNEGRRIFYYNLGRDIDYLITSYYHSILATNDYYVYCKGQDLPSINKYKFLNNSLNSVLKNKIFAKIALPSGIIPM